MENKAFSMLFLDEFHGGNLTVNAHYGVMFMSNLIKPKGPGHLVVTGRFRGPKEWSPHGIVPQEWVEILRLSAGCSMISVAYKRKDQSPHRHSYEIKPRDKQTVFFVPGQPGRIPGPP